MFENDVEFFTDELDAQNKLKGAIWRDDEFSAFVSEVGLEAALYEVTDFHANVADQLRSRGVASPTESDWASRTIGLCVRLKSRRQQLRRALRATPGGEDLVREVTAEVKSDWTE